MSANGRLVITVKDAMTPSNVLRGAKVTVSRETPPYSSQKVTDEHGVAEFQLDPGAYTLTHDAAAPNYALPDEALRTKPVEIRPAGSTEETLTELPPGQLQVSVRDATNTQTVLAGAKLKIEQVGSLVRQFESAVPAQAESLTPGLYSVTQTAAPAGFLLPSVATWEGRLDSGSTSKVVFDDLPGGTLLIRAVRRGAMQPLGGAVVSIVLSGGGYENRIVTTSQEAKVSGLKPGTYAVTEEKGPLDGNATLSLPVDRTRTVAVAVASSTPVDFIHDDGAAPRTSNVLQFVSWVVVAGLFAWAAWALFKQYWATLFAVAPLLVGLTLIALFGAKRGFFAPLVGADGRISTSKAQVGLWTVVLVWALAFLLGKTLFANAQLSTVLPEARWDEYLILLGGPYAAAVISKGIVSSKVQDGSLQKPDNSSVPGLDQLVRNDAGRADLIDSQYLLFNLVALAYFIVAMAKESVLPEMPPTLLALTSGAAALYAANKAVETNRPTITGVTPATLLAGQDIKVNGQNFRPAGTQPDDHVAVELQGVGSLAVVRESDSEAVAVAPPVVPPGARTLRVTSAAGVGSNEWPVWGPMQ
jgi:hypothetical protein